MAFWNVKNYSLIGKECITRTFYFLFLVNDSVLIFFFFLERWITMWLGMLNAASVFFYFLRDISYNKIL